MPELPEVETTRRGVASALGAARVSDVIVRDHRLRYPVPADLQAHLCGQAIQAYRRRAKYLLIDFARGSLLIHLGMSGSLRVLPADTPPQKHDHVDIVCDKSILRLHDPRRFGAVLWLDSAADTHPLLANLGPEPLEPGFDGTVLHAAARSRRCAVKLMIMDAAVVVGVGNIYASESLFRAGIHPHRPAHRVSLARYHRLATEIRATLEDALAAGGSTLRDFVRSDGQPGYFQQQYSVYGRDGQPCRVCGTSIQRTVTGQRASFYCPACQR